MVRESTWARLSRPAAVLATALLAVACGGGGGDSGAAPGPIPSQAWGQVDAEFGGTGKVVVPGSSYVPESRMSLGPDGSLYVLGDEGLEKRGADGNPVTSFGHGGRLMSGFQRPPLGDEAGNLFGLTQGALVKLDPAGQPVPSFGTNGRVAWEGWVAGDIRVFAFRSLARDAAGNLFMAGSGHTPGDAQGFRWGVVAKLDREGRLVTSFGNYGLAVFDSAHAGRAVRAETVVLDARGNQYIVGGLIAKLDPSGNLMRDFAEQGYLRAPNCAEFRVSEARALVIDSAGDLVAGAVCDPPDTNMFEVLVFKFDERGVVSPSFRESGMRRGLFGTPSSTGDAGMGMGAMVVAPGGAIYVSGHRSATECGVDLVVAKLDAQGNAVPTFDGKESVVLDGQRIDYSGDLALDAQGRVYAASSGVPYCPIIRPMGGGSVFVYRIRG